MRIGKLELVKTLRFSVWGLQENVFDCLAEAAVGKEWSPVATGDVHEAFKDLEDLEMFSSPSGGDEATRFGRVGNPLRDVKVLVTTDESVFVEELDGSRSRHWLPIDQLEGAPNRSNSDDWRESIKTFLDKFSQCPLASSTMPAPLPASLAKPWAPGHPVVYRGLLNATDRASIFAAARDCFQSGWGTVRRRSVGLPEKQYLTTPSQTHLRLTRHFREMAPNAWAHLRDATAHADGVLGTKLSASSTITCTAPSSTTASAMVSPPLEDAFKQADFLHYSGAGKDWVGWHDHAGESELFIVALLADGFGGGSFMYRNALSKEEVALDLKLGDAVVCPSSMEHCVRPLTSGLRVSLNIDFWGVAQQADTRSAANKY